MLNVPISVNDLPRGSAWRVVATVLIAIFLMLGLYGATVTYAAPSAVTWPTIHLEPVASGFINPIDVVSANDGTGRLFVVERGGLVYIIENGERLETPFLDISDRVATCDECGLLGLAFPPGYAEKGYFFVNYTSLEANDVVPPDTGDDDSPTVGDTVIARFHITNNLNLADAEDEAPILRINQPDTNHNGGHILFGPDGYLYIGMGDGGGGGDEFENAQDPASLLGKILRIEVGAVSTYTVPASNPFTGTTGYRDEIWATGVRNPWRFGFDRSTGDLYVADVGQGGYEEVNHVAASDIVTGGMNFGWPTMEGNVCFPPAGPPDCDSAGLTTPVATYDHGLGCSITGGHVFRSIRPAQAPVYLYADYCTGRLWGLQADGNEWASVELDDFDFQVTSFGEDEEGKIYVVSYAGTIYQVVNSPVSLQYIPTISKRE